MAEGKDAVPGRWRLSKSIWRRVWTVQSLVVLVGLALTLPILSIYLSMAVRGSDQPVLADLDVVSSLFQPGGLIVLAVVLLLWLVIELLGHATQMVVAHEQLHHRETGVPASLAHVASHIKGLLILILRFALQSFALALPFLLLVAGVLHLQLGQRELDYYLATRPPEFVFALTLVALLLVGMAFALIRHLIDWLLALPLLLFHDHTPVEARRGSRQRATGHRARLFLQLIGWIAIPPLIVLGTAIALVSPLLQAAHLIDHRVGLTSLLVVIAIAICAGIGFLSRLIGASFFCAYHARLSIRTGLKEGPKRPESEPSALAAWGIAWGSVAIIAVCVLASRSWLEEMREDPDVAIVAHRGASEETPENTLAAIEAAIEAEADLIEVDVQQHPSGELYLFHDKDLKRVAGKAVRLRELDPESIGEIDVGSWMSPEFKDERIPTLDEALNLCRGRVKLMVELKSFGPRDPMAKAVVAAVEEAGMVASVSLMSFDAELVKKLEEMRPDWRIGFVSSSPPDLSDVAELEFLALGRGILNRDLTRRADRRDLAVYGWTLNEPIDISSAISRGATGIITDRPRAARRVLDERAQLNPAERLTLDLLSHLGMIHDLLRS